MRYAVSKATGKANAGQQAAHASGHHIRPLAFILTFPVIESRAMMSPTGVYGKFFPTLAKDLRDD